MISAPERGEGGGDEVKLSLAKAPFHKLVVCKEVKNLLVENTLRKVKKSQCDCHCH